MEKLLHKAYEYARQYLELLPDRKVFPDQEALASLEKLDFSLPPSATNPLEVLALLHQVGAGTTVASTGGRYFGYVFGGTLPASLAASWLASTWDQNAAFINSSPVAARLEEVASKWLLQLFDLPRQAAVGFVTGTTMANFSAVLAARNQLLSRLGWDVAAQGLTKAPALQILVGEEVHVSLLKALQMAGFGTRELTTIPTDAQGRIISEKLPELTSATLVCLQAGNVNTGSVDPMLEICREAQRKNAWVHIDGAFGLWAAVSPEKKHLLAGYQLADSWAIDLHKWLNVPYDSGLIICKQEQALRTALSVGAPYLPEMQERQPYLYTPELSRRARGIEVWAALYSLGESGVREMIDRCCALARLFANILREAGFSILNEVLLNQVLVSFGEPQVTDRIVRQIQLDGTCWCGGTVWKGQTAMRISISSWATTRADIEVCAGKITEIALKEISKAG